MLKKLGVLFILLLLLTLIGCKEARKPAIPLELQVIDLPSDDGTGVLINWIHFNASPTLEYEIWRGDSEEDLKLITKKRVQSGFEIPRIEASDNLIEDDYYIVLENDSEIPSLKLIQANIENRDSLSRIGEKVLFLEKEIAPPDLDTLKQIYVRGDYFKIIAQADEASRPNFITRTGKLTDVAEGFYTIESGDNALEIAIEKSADEIAFLEQKQKIYENDLENSKYIKKYGLKIASFVTQTKRYCMIHASFQHVDVEGIEIGKNFFYKVVAVGLDGSRIESEVLEVTTLDNIPAPPLIQLCGLDSTENSLIMRWRPTDSDISKFSLFYTDEGDTNYEFGHLISEFGADWSSAKIDFQESFQGKSFYLQATDKGGQSARSALVTPSAFEVGEILLPPGLTLVEPPNDKWGNVLQVQWEPAQLYVEYMVVEDNPPQLESKKFSFEDQNCYLVSNPETGQHEVVCSREWTEPMDYIAKVLWVRQDQRVKGSEPGPKNLIISYESAYHHSYIDKILQDVGFVRAKLDEGKWHVDRMELEKFKFLEISPEQHKLTVQFLGSSGKPMSHPEANIELEIDATEPNSYSPEIPPHYYDIFRFRDGEDMNFAKKLTTLPATAREHRDVLDSTQYAYHYFLRANSPSGGFVDSPLLGPLKAHNEIFDTNKATVFILMVIFISVALYFFNNAKRGKKFYIRPIAGIEHVDEALGRATEMGRPALFVLGLSSIGDIATLAGITVLGRVANRAAKYNTRVIVPCYDPIVMLVAQETVKSACIEAGRPDAYREEDVFFVTTSQFAYAAAVNGIMLREKTATNFYMGMFYAESLLLAETGTRMGAIQIAGTDAVTQIPFFITTCDYTLIGEELYAASAYLSDEPIQVGSLKAQDYGKAIVMFLIVLGILLMTVHQDWIYHLFTVVTQ
ncbi:hypothetical protein JW877_00715 [bacterium]|nr:hypothetical protein [bacterium]